MQADDKPDLRFINYLFIFLHFFISLWKQFYRGNEGISEESRGRQYIFTCLVPWSQRFSLLVDGGKIYQKKRGVKYPQRASVVTIKRTNRMVLRVCKNINQSMRDTES